MTIALASLPRATNETVINMLMQDPEGRVDDMIDRYHTQSLSRITCQNAAVVVNRGNGTIIHNYEPLPTPKINQLVVPTGSTRWSYCLLLADDEIKKKVYEASDNGAVGLNLIYGTPITGREEKQHSITLTVYTLPPRRVSHGDGKDVVPDANQDAVDGEEAVNKLWIIPVVDARYWWQFLHTGTLAQDIIDADFLPEDAVKPPDALIDLAFQITGNDLLNVKVNTAHTLLPSCSSLNDYENFPIVFDSILANYGQRLVVDIGSYDTVTGKYNEVTATLPPQGNTRFACIDGKNSRDVFDNALLGKLGLRECVWGGGGTSLATSASAADYIIGKPFIVAGGMQSTQGTDYTKYALCPASVDIQTIEGSYTRKSPGSEYKTSPGTAIWRTEFDAAPPAGMVDQIGRDYFYQFFRQFDYTFAGVQPWQQTYFDDYMVLRQTWNPKLNCYDAYTRVCSRQPNLTGEWVKPGTGTGTATTTCSCNCIANGDIVVNGIETTSRWSVKMTIQTFKQANGKIILPAATYVLLYDALSGTWTLDIGDFLTATYTSGTNATVDTTMDGTLTMGFDAYGAPYLTLCVDGTVPAEVP